MTRIQENTRLFGENNLGSERGFVKPWLLTTNLA